MLLCLHYIAIREQREILISTVTSSLPLLRSSIKVQANRGQVLE